MNLNISVNIVMKILPNTTMMVIREKEANALDVEWISP